MSDAALKVMAAHRPKWRTHPDARIACTCGWVSNDPVVMTALALHDVHVLTVLSETHAVVELPAVGVERLWAIRRAAKMRQDSTRAVDLPWSKLTDAQKLPWMLRALAEGGPQPYDDSKDDCSRHRPPQGPNEDIAGFCSKCGRGMFSKRPPGETFGNHLPDCSLPVDHESYCVGGGTGHPPSRKVRG